MRNEKIHSTLLGLVGAYLVYMAWHLYELGREGDPSMTAPLRILFIAVFALAGLGVMFFAWTIWRKEKEKEQKGDPEERMEKETGEDDAQ